MTAVGGRESSADGRLAYLELSDAQALRECVRELRPEVIVHLGGIIPSRGASESSRLRAVNVEATRILLEAATSARMVFASTAAVYGDQHDAPVAEGHVGVPAPGYASSKRDAELALEELVAGREDLSAVVLRIFNVYGHGFDESLVNRLRAANSRHPVLLRGWSNFVRDYVHVADLVKIIGRAIDIPGRYEIFNVGSGIERSNAQLVRELSVPLGSIEVTSDMSSYSVADVSKLRSSFGGLTRCGLAD